MRHAHLASRGESALVVIDIQERLLAAMHQKERVEANASKLIRLAKILNLPILVTEQYPKGLGPTVPLGREALESGQPSAYQPLKKTQFSCFAVEPSVHRLEEQGAKTLLVVGIECHICVSQTALDGLAQGYQVLADGTSSRTEENWRIGLEKMRQAGVIITSFETVAFELLEQANTALFREAQPLLK